MFAAGTILLLVLTLVPNYFKQSIFESKKILGTATTGFELLRSGEFKGALLSFNEAQAALKNSQNILAGFLKVLPSGLDPKNLLEAGTLVSEAADLALQGFSDFMGAKIVWDGATNASNQNLYQGLKVSHEKLAQALENLTVARGLLVGVNLAVLPQEYRQELLRAQRELDLALSSVSALTGFERLLLGILGGESKTYVMIFQNNSEMRATGGFIGTYGIIRFENGTVHIERIESVYALDGQLQETIAAPGPLRRQLTQFWGMRDSNWFVDFEASARKILEFMEKEGGILAEGVVAVTPNVFEELLKITGPIAMPEYGETLDSENFRRIVQNKTSLDYDRTLNEPKKFLTDFAPRLLSRFQFLAASDWLSVVSVLSAATTQKQLLAFSIDPEIQKQFESFGLDGKIKPTSRDYLAVFHSNVGGGKTDQNISQKIEKRVSIDSGGLVIVRLKITRAHKGFDEQFFPKNLDFMRILVPRQAKLLQASGFSDHELLPSSFEGARVDADLEKWDQSLSRHQATGMYVGEEAGYKFFANFLELLPGEAKTVELTYEIQFSEGKTYTQLLQKQPGSPPFDFSFEINYLPGEIEYFYPETFQREDRALFLSETVTTDKFYGVIGK